MGANERAESDLSVRIAASVGPNETAVGGPDEVASGAGPRASAAPASDARRHALTTVDAALRLAVKHAVDSGDYESAAAVLGVLKRRSDGS
jgi:hypothetical protein